VTLLESQLFLGVDGGYSGSRALLIDRRGCVLGAGLGGNANHAGQGYDSAITRVMDAVRGAMAHASATLSDIAFAQFALAGDDVEDDHTGLCSALEAPFGGVPFQLANDVWAGLRAGSTEGFGVAVNCGSGTGAVGKRPDGTGIIIPDLGYIFGDSGGGNQIGVDAVRAVVRAWDGRGSPTDLTEPILALTEQPSVPALYLAMYRGSIDRSLMPRCTRFVFQAAAKGDVVATAILEHIGDELGVSAGAIARRLQICEGKFPFVLTGGAIRTLKSPLAQAAIDRLRSTAPCCVPTLPRLMPVAGAALMALDGAGIRVTDDHFEYLRSQGQGWHAEEIYSDQD
jgi:N-acetylglucosamine kinase-like BadF-type ATPase